MKIECLEPSGYCAGVKRAIKIAIEAKNNNPDKNVFVFGMLVHNDQVMNELKNMGIGIIDDLNYISKNDVLIIPAHGMSKINYDLCKQKQVILYDATCPKVESNIKLIKESKGPIIYIGYKNHSETKAAISYSDNIYLYDVYNGFDTNVKINDALVLNQTTISIKDLSDIYEKLKNNFSNISFSDEICNSTRIRQEGVVGAKEDIDCFIVVGDPKSSNTNRLFELAKESHPDSYTIMIDNCLKLDKNMLKNKKHIFVIGGASTSPETIDSVLNFLKELK